VLPVGCAPKKPEPIALGKDQCSQCRMILSDPRFGCQLITPKGKVFKFDDVNCMVNYADREDACRGSGCRLYIVDFTDKRHFLPVEEAVFFFHPRLRSPMGSGIGAFPARESLEETHAAMGEGGGMLRWNEVRSRFSS
jgi:copper chaperone NosL